MRLRTFQPRARRLFVASRPRPSPALGPRPRSAQLTIMLQGLGMDLVESSPGLARLHESGPPELRLQTRSQVLTMSMQAEMHNVTIANEIGTMPPIAIS